MLTENPWALKEWACVVKALGAGRTVLVLRKGGIAETGGEFTVEHREFFLYPTYEHQNRQELIPQAQSDLDEVLAHQPPAWMILFNDYATVQHCQWITDLAALKRLQPHQRLTEQAIERRFQYGRDHGLHAIVLCVARLPQPIQVPVLPMYNGCKSWVKLERALPVARAAPVLSDAAFAEQFQQIQALLP